MKKTLLATILSLAAFAASAADVSLATVYDYKADRAGARVGVDVGKGWLKPEVSATFYGGQSARLAAGASAEVYKFNQVTFSTALNGEYVNATNGPNGYAWVGALRASYPLQKNFTLRAGLERTWAQDRIKWAQGNQATLGVSYTF